MNFAPARSFPRTLLMAALAPTIILSACGTLTARAGADEPPAAPAASAATAAPAPSLEAALPAPHEPLAKLTFMTGTWITADAAPGKAFNEETWSVVRGGSLVSVFRRIGDKGKPQIIELISITHDAEGVTLRLRHFHGDLEPGKDENDSSVFRMQPMDPAAKLPSVTFTAVKHTRGTASISYALQADGTLREEWVQEVKAGETPKSDVFVLKKVAVIP